MLLCLHPQIWYSFPHHCSLYYYFTTNACYSILNYILSLILIGNFVSLSNLFQIKQYQGLGFYICYFENIRCFHSTFAFLNHCLHLFVNFAIFWFSVFYFIPLRNQIFDFLFCLILTLIISKVVYWAWMNFCGRPLSIAEPLSFFGMISHFYLMIVMSF